MKIQTTERRQRTRLALFFLVSVALAAPSVAWGADGVIEINQARALAGSLNGNPFVDPPGFPVYVIEGGSYVLTSDLIVSTPDTNGIVLYTASGVPVTGDPVSLDLNGFSIVGPASCTGEGASISCSAWSGIGIDASNDGRSRATIIKNGRVSGFGIGVLVRMGGGGCILRDLVVTGNTSTGVSLTNDITSTNGPCIVSRSDLTKNGVWGLISDGPTIVRDSTVYGNGSDGLSSLFDPVAVFRNTIRGNGGRGVRLRGHSLMVDSSVGDNALEGILTAFPSVSYLLGNSIYGNTGSQLELDNCGTFSNSVITSAGGGTTVSHSCLPSVSMGPNLCDGSLTCP